MAGAAAVVAVAALAAAPAPDPVARDTFAHVADELHLADLPPGTLLTAAPEAYGFLLRDRPVAAARPGARGLVLLDGAQRLYAPGLRARGRIVARLPAGDGFLRPNGTLDSRPVVVVSGRVAAQGG